MQIARVLSIVFLFAVGSWSVQARAPQQSQKPGSVPPKPSQAAPAQVKSPDTAAPKPLTLTDSFAGLEFRSIGPFRGGRVVAVTGVRGKPLLYYFGGTGSGVWKTTDGGTTWVNISDKFFKTGSVGAIAVAESDPNVIFAGMGETAIRGSTSSHGDGVYKSTDAGATWTHVGLADTRQIARVRIHPQNPDIVYVAAQGHIWGPNEARGIYRTRDGGAKMTDSSTSPGMPARHGRTLRRKACLSGSASMPSTCRRTIKPQPTWRP